MASNLNDYEELERRVKLVGDYVKKTGFSTRKTAKYFTENYFQISNATVSDYLKRYAMMGENKQIIEQITSKNTPKSIEDDGIKTRVLQVYNSIKEGYTIEEIAEFLNTDYWTVYYDVVKRLKRLDEDKYYEIKEIFENRKKSNLKNNKSM